MLLVTTAPAPMMLPFPIVTPGSMMTLNPIQQSSSIITFPGGNILDKSCVDLHHHVYDCSL